MAGTEKNSYEASLKSLVGKADDIEGRLRTVVERIESIHIGPTVKDTASTKGFISAPSITELDRQLNRIQSLVTECETFLGRIDQ